MGGYSFNWVCNKHFLVNVTAMPGIGIASSKEYSTDGKAITLSLIAKAMGSVTYNLKKFYVSAQATFDGNLYRPKSISFITGIPNFKLSAGFRF